MNQLLNLKSKFWYNTKLYFGASMIAAGVMAFVFVSYMALTHNEPLPKKSVETTKEISSIENTGHNTFILEING